MTIKYQDLVILDCPICGGRAELSAYSRGVFVCGCVGDYCMSLPMCGTTPEVNAVRIWNEWVLSHAEKDVI